MRDKYDRVVNEAFRAEKKAQKKLKEAFEDFINADSRCASYLVLYIDEVCRALCRPNVLCVGRRHVCRGGRRHVRRGGVMRVERRCEWGDLGRSRRAARAVEWGQEASTRRGEKTHRRSSRNRPALAAPDTHR